jgi:hypothetical protein
MTWFSPKDTLPDDGDDVLIAHTWGGVFVGRRWADEGMWEIDGHDHEQWDDNDVAYWMSIPEVPEP